MKSWMLLSSLAWSLALVTHELPAKAPPGAEDPPAAAEPSPVTVVRSVAHRLQSKIVDDVYEVRVALPEDYENDQELRPVVYAMDGQWNFTLLADIAGKLAFDGSIPDPIVVGVTWADAAFQPAAERVRDFTPVPTGAPGSGGAANFLRVLETEIFPLVESTYRASTQRVITGGSLGGLFVSYALLERPDLFQGYIASSVVPGSASEYFATRLLELEPGALQNERAYFSVGSQYDNAEATSAFVGDLRALFGEASKLVLDVVPGLGHTGNETFGYLRGLLHVFQRPRLVLDDELLQSYEGDYFDVAYPELPALTIETAPGELYVSEGGVPWGIVFYAASPTHFYAEGIDIDLTFYTNAEGQQAFRLSYRRTPYENVRR